MIFYGDVSKRVSSHEACDAIGELIARACGASLAIDRHACWVGALLAAGELAQGLADAALQQSGGDASGIEERAAMVLAVALADVMGRSSDSGFKLLPAAPPQRVVEAWDGLRGLDLRPAEIEIRRTEGFAHYGVYPEAFWSAARRPGPRPGGVIGIRSIGTTLAAAVSAAVGVPLPLTLRPLGHPFDREVRPGPGLDAAMRRGAGSVWGIVDEGPGLSGSSFTAVADALAARGTPASRIVLFPSHGNPPGTMADARRRRLWEAAERRVADSDGLLLPREDPHRGLARWVEDITGPNLGEAIDVAGGAWRAHRFERDTDWPVVDRQNERRKYLVDATNGRFLLKFTGLGAFGHAKYARAKALGAAGFTVPPLGWRHGFLVEPWLVDTRPVISLGPSRCAFLDHLARYLGFRARSFPASQEDGASLDVLLAMARANAREALGEAVEPAFRNWAGQLDRLAGSMRPVAIDGRLQAWEWLVDRQGRWLKTDALDHCCGHDLVGCQDIAWDIAGGAVEYGLSPEEAETLRAAVAREAGRESDPRLVAMFRVVYAAFVIGSLTMARDREEGPEASRLNIALDHARQILRREIGIAAGRAIASQNPWPR